MITLRPILISDEAQMLDILTDTDIRKTYMLPDFESKESALPLFHRLCEMSVHSDVYVRGICRNDTVIGMINCTEIQADSIELGYALHPSCWNHGYVFQALQKAIRELFSLGYRRVIAGAFETNTASIRVMEKSGMRIMDKTDSIIYHGEKHRCVYYCIEKQE